MEISFTLSIILIIIALGSVILPIVVALKNPSAPPEIYHDECDHYWDRQTCALCGELRDESESEYDYDVD